MGWPHTRFELLYDSQVRREAILDLQAERRAQIRALLSNGGYLQSPEGIKVRSDEIEKINQHFDEIIEEIQDPGKAEREQRAIEENPLFSAGIRGLDRLKWDYIAAQEAVKEARRMQGL